MQRILLTGMSGTGKSTLIQSVRKLGFKAFDMDEPGWSEYRADGEWIWREERVKSLLSETDDEILFISGCAENQVKFYDQFDQIVLLTAPAKILRERLITRANNSYGKSDVEWAEVLHNLETVEPLLRRGATHEISTNIPLEEVLERILSIIRMSQK